mmetsp:Transcript_13269/g.37246  ORF Transcript_13269/g.37246 Transcript_13269/m.37246 type:complete len:209 (-) Transcript_13269:1404-2030(-)
MNQLMFMRCTHLDCLCSILLILPSSSSLRAFSSACCICILLSSSLLSLSFSCFAIALSTASSSCLFNSSSFFCSSASFCTWMLAILLDLFFTAISYSLSLSSFLFLALAVSSKWGTISSLRTLISSPSSSSFSFTFLQKLSTALDFPCLERAFFCFFWPARLSSLSKSNAHARDCMSSNVVQGVQNSLRDWVSAVRHVFIVTVTGFSA